MQTPVVHRRTYRHSMIIPVTPIRQDTPYACATTCLRMLFRYYGVHVSQGEIEEFLTHAPSEGTAYLTELARFAVIKGLRATCFGFNLALFDPHRDTDLSGYRLIQHLEDQRQMLRDREFVKMLRAIGDAVKGGVNYQIVRPTLSLLKDMIYHKRPFILSLCHAGLFQSQGDVYAGHTVVVNGLQHEQFWFIDPTDGQQRTTNADDLLFAMFSRKLIADDAYMLAVHCAQASQA